MERTPSYRHTRSVTPSATGLRLCLGMLPYFRLSFSLTQLLKTPNQICLSQKSVFKSSLPWIERDPLRILHDIIGYISIFVFYSWKITFP